MTHQVSRVVFEFDVPSMRTGEQLLSRLSHFGATRLETAIDTGFGDKSFRLGRLEVDLGDLPMRELEPRTEERIIAALSKLEGDIPGASDNTTDQAENDPPDAAFNMLATGVGQPIAGGIVDPANVAQHMLAMPVQQRQTLLQRALESATAAKRLVGTTTWPEFAALAGIHDADQIKTALDALRHRLGWNVVEFRSRSRLAILHLFSDRAAIDIRRIEAYLAASTIDAPIPAAAPSVGGDNPPSKSKEPAKFASAPEFLSALHALTEIGTPSAEALSRLAEIFAGLDQQQLGTLARSVKSAEMRAINVTRLIEALPPWSLMSLLRVLFSSTDAHANLLVDLAGTSHFHGQAALVRRLLMVGLQQQPSKGEAILQDTFSRLLGSADLHPADLINASKRLRPDQRTMIKTAVDAFMSNRRDPAGSQRPPAATKAQEWPAFATQLHTFLRYGLMGGQTVLQLRNQVSDIITSDAATLRDLIDAFPFCRNRLVDLLEPSTRIELLNAVGADRTFFEAVNVLQDMAKGVILETDNAAFRIAAAAALTATFETQSGPDRCRVLVREVFGTLAEQTGLLPDDLATAMLNTNKETPADVAELLVAQAKTASAFLRGPGGATQRKGLESTSAMDMPETIYVDNAGCVLLWPFLPQLLRALDLFVDGEFRSRAAQHKSAQLVHFLATGEETPAEHAVGLPKLLCGIPLNDVAEVGQTLTQEERSLSADLLHAVTQNWPGLENTSSDGLRETFLTRSGVLKLQPEETVLHVESGPFDMLLDRLTWAISTISLSWMAHPLHVKWRDQ
ncbi:contractile injection system tape measure protein [uncultured Litoreibacter sp.]|uniref:contractile injection system tape measure protein n=1 Tax=uncultured Litoreibacter sp. TaxID=1392394 RepID=UPI00261ED64E|nr:contractile injection system tape measure protein [uncultured Litoreibacter sp.]